MPLKRTYSTSTSIVPAASYQQLKKRNVSKRRGISARPQLLSAPGTPFPQRCRAQLKYTSYVNLDPPVGTVGLQYIRCNSVYDPDATGAGGQPRGFDQYAQLYDQYTVTNAKMKCWAVLPPGTGASNGGLMLGVSIVDDTGTSPAVDACADRPFTTYKIVNSSAAMKDQTVMSSWNRNKRFPKSETYLTLSAAITNNPAEMEFFQVWTYPAISPLGTDGSSFTLQYEIVYDVEFYELKQIPAS